MKSSLDSMLSTKSEKATGKKREWEKGRKKNGRAGGREGTVPNPEVNEQEGVLLFSTKSSHIRTIWKKC